MWIWQKKWIKYQHKNSYSIPPRKLFLWMFPGVINVPQYFRDGFVILASFISFPIQQSFLVHVKVFQQDFLDVFSDSCGMYKFFNLCASLFLLYFVSFSYLFPLGLFHVDFSYPTYPRKYWFSRSRLLTLKLSPSN